MNDQAIATEQAIFESPLCHMEQVRGLIPLRHPTAEALLAALGDGRPVPLRSKEGGAVQSDLPVAVADVSAHRLERELAALAARAERERRTVGESGLCLAVDRLVGLEGVSAPLLFQRVQLERTEEGWFLCRSGEDEQVNAAALRRLSRSCSPPEEGWSNLPETLAAQLDGALTDESGWRRQDGLWLGHFPLHLLELPDLLRRPLWSRSFGAYLKQDERRDYAPLPDIADTDGEEGLLAPVPLDGAQMSALRYVTEGNSLLVEGHRGTGKTQLAASLIANAMGARQRVLAVSSHEADRRALLERLEGMGLSELCLSLPSEGDQKLALIHQYDRSAQLRPETDTGDYFALAAATVQRAGELNRAAAELHTPCHCGLTPFELICRYSEVRDEEGYLPVSEQVAEQWDAEALDERLSYLSQLTAAARTLGRPWDHPLSFVRGDLFDPAVVARLPRGEARLRSAIDGLEAAAQPWLSRTGLERPRTREEWERLRAAGRLLLDWREMPDAWAVSPRVPMLSDTVQELKSRTEWLERQRREIEAHWGEKVLSMDAETLEQQWKSYKAEWTLPSEPDRESALRRLSVEAEALLDRLEQSGRRWSKCVNVPVPTTRDSWERYYEVALELARWKEIPNEWGSCSGLQALLWDVGELIEVGRQAKESKDVLLRDWTEEFLSLDGKALSAQWAKEGGSWGMGWLKRQTPTRTLLEPYCKTKMTTDLAESGLRWLVDYQEELAQCDEIYHRWERELRSVYRREETVWVWLEAARRVAAESHDWLSELTGSEDFLRQYGSNEEAISAAVELQELWERSRDVLGRLDVMIGRTAQPETRDWLTVRRGDCRRLRSLMSIRKQLEELAKEPIPMGQIAQTLSILARYQREEAALDALIQRWSAELGDLYSGADTDWDTLYPRSVQAVESDDRIAELTGDLELRVRLVRDEAALAETEALSGAIESVQAAEADMEAQLSAALVPEGGEWLTSLRENSRTVVSHLDQLETWMGWHALCSRADELGLGAFAAHFAQPVPDGEDTEKLFLKSLYRALVICEVERVPGRKLFSSRRFQESLRQYALLHRQFTRRTEEELFHVAAAQIPALPQEEEVQEALNLLRWANRTEAKDISLPSLLEGLKPLGDQLFPCVVASPAEALRLLEGEQFDYMILERCEQLPRSVGEQLLGMGRVALLFSSGRGGDGQAAPHEESVRQRCRALGVPTLALERCYLPRPEGLARLDRALFGTTGIPSPRPTEGCIRYKTVVGRMDGFANPAEASAVAEQALLLREQGDRSLAVVAMSWEQAARLRALLPDGTIPVLTPDEVVCGRWERVLLSLTLAADGNEGLETAKALLARWDGGFPFSDALSAAIGEVWVFSSLDGEDRPALGRLSPELTRFLAIAEEERLEEEPVPFRDPIQRELCAALREQGWDATPAPEPLSVRVNVPELPPLGILLDDEVYGRIPRTPERELTREALLRRQGWRLQRVWTLDWWRDRRQVTEHLAEVIPQPRQADGSAAAAPQTEVPPLFAPAQLTVMGIRAGEVYSPAFQNRVYRVVEEILRQESPAAVSQLTERMLTAFGLDAADPELTRRCASLFRKLGLRITHEPETDFVWLPNQDPDRYREYRRCGTGAHYRPPEDVSCQESANAACAVLRERTALTPEALARETARQLGYRPWDEDARDCGRRGVEYALFMGRMTETVYGSIVLKRRKR